MVVIRNESSSIKFIHMNALGGTYDEKNQVGTSSCRFAYMDSSLYINPHHSNAANSAYRHANRHADTNQYTYEHSNCYRDSTYYTDEYSLSRPSNGIYRLLCFARHRDRLSAHSSTGVP